MTADSTVKPLAEVEQVRKVRAAMASGSRSRAAHQARARQAILRRMRTSPGVDAFALVDTVSHETNTPPTAVKVAIHGLLKDGVLMVDRQHRHVLSGQPE